MELRLPLPHVLHLEARPADIRGRNPVTIRDLFRATLRMRPDRIVIGEIRGGESLDLIQAMTSGHRGCLSTVHATYPVDTLNRLETLALMSDVDVTVAALRAQISSAVDIIVQTSRSAEGFRCITHITEVAGYDVKRGFVLSDLFERTYSESCSRHPSSTLRYTGRAPRCRTGIEAAGLRLPLPMQKREANP
jgi:pilus assembly protein CpaF